MGLWHLHYDQDMTEYQKYNVRCHFESLQNDKLQTYAGKTVENIPAPKEDFEPATDLILNWSHS